MARRIGLALARASEILGAEPFFHELIAGVERVLAPHDVSFLLKVVATPAEATATIERWAAAGQVDGIVLIDLLPDDPRVGLARRLGLPTVVIGDPVTAQGLDTVWAEDDVAMRDAAAILAGLGHRRVAHVTGPAALAHTRIRSAAFAAAAAELGIEAIEIEGDYSQDSGAMAASALCAADPAPSAIIADNDLMAIGALARAHELGWAVPGAVSILAWDDSALCQLANPPLSAMSHDVQGVGELVGSSLLAALERREPRVVTAPRASFVLRGSTGVAPINE